MKFLYNKEFFCTKIDLRNLKIILPFLKLDIIGARLESNGLLLSGNIYIDIQLATFLSL